MNKEFIFILWAKWHVANFDMPMWCQFGWHMSSSNLINLMTLIWNLPLNFDVAFCNWLDKFLPPTIDTTNFTIFLQILKYQFLTSRNKIIKYEIVINHNWKINVLRITITIVGGCHLEGTIKTVCIGPMIQWPNPRMAH